MKTHDERITAIETALGTALKLQENNTELKQALAHCMKQKDLLRKALSGMVELYEALTVKPGSAPAHELAKDTLAVICVGKAEL